MANTISKLSLNDDLMAIIRRYQEREGIEDLTVAIYQLIALGYADWMMYTVPNPNPAYGRDETEGNALWEEWESTEGMKPKDMRTPFEIWWAKRIAPKHGGHRGKRPAVGEWVILLEPIQFDNVNLPAETIAVVLSRSPKGLRIQPVGLGIEVDVKYRQVKKNA